MKEEDSSVRTGTLASEGRNSRFQRLEAEDSFKRSETHAPQATSPQNSRGRRRTAERRDLYRARASARLFTPAFSSSPQGRARRHCLCLNHAKRDETRCFA